MRSRKRYLLVDGKDKYFRRRSDRAANIAYEMNKRKKAAPDCELTVYELNENGEYKLCGNWEQRAKASRKKYEAFANGLVVEKFSFTAANRDCIRNSVRCGHCRRFSEFGGGYFCHYLLDTGHTRDCEAGAACRRYTTELCRTIDNYHTQGGVISGMGIYPRKEGVL